MDGLKDTVPLGKPYEEFYQMSPADFFEDISDFKVVEPDVIPCRIYNWRKENLLVFKTLKEK